MPTLPDATKHARAVATAARIDAAATPGKLKIYGNTRPSANSSPGAAPLATITLQDPCGSVSSAGVLTLSASAATQITNSGTPVWGRFEDGDGNAVMDCSAGTSGTEVIVDQATFYAGAFVIMVSATFTEGG